MKHLKIAHSNLATESQTLPTAGESFPTLDDRSPAEKTMRKVRNFPSDAHGHFYIDENGYLVLHEMALRSHLSSDMHAYINSHTQTAGPNRRVYKIQFSFLSSIYSISDSIGLLSDLEHLDLSYLKNITTIPPSIGKLQKLECLRLYDTKLSSLPAEIGDLTSLKKMILSWSMITSLPASIGQLQNLEYLEISSAKLLSLPEETGDLVGLEKLIITSSPKLKSLPDEIGNLTNLKKLDLVKSGITSLPSTIARLAGLMTLNLDETPISKLEGKASDEYFRELVQQCQALGCLGRAIERRSKIPYGLACNRARYRTGFGSSHGDCTETAMGLWPHVLEFAVHAFLEYPGFLQYNYPCREFDAIHQVLLDGRESFVKLLINCTLTTNLPMGKTTTSAQRRQR